MATGRVLYRKYRPTSLDTVVGQPQVTDALKNALKQHKIGHAYLFIGPRGTGKTSVARILAHAINDFPYDLEDSYLDIIEIDAASNTGVDNIRELREKAIIAPTKGKYKVYIIDEVHMLSKSAANALLKTLEEPPEHVVFIMATTEAHKVPITISSRTQVLNFQLASPETMFEHLRKIADTEEINITDSALRVVVRRGGGSFRDSLSLLDQVATLTDQEITDTVINKSFGLPAEEAIRTLLTAYETRNATALQRTLASLINSGLRPENIAAELIEAIIARPTPRLLTLLEKLPNVQPPFPEAKLLLALIQDLSFESSKPTEPPKPTSNPTEAPKSVENTPAPVLDSAENPLEAPIPHDVPVVAPTIATEPTSAPTFDPTASNSETKVETTSPKAKEPQPNQKPEGINPLKTASKPSSDNFDWNNLLETIRNENQAIYLQLQKTEHELTDDTLHIYPLQKFTAKILKKAENSQVVAAHLGNLALIVHDLEDRQTPQDSTLSQISAIMGEVREINDDMPF